MENVSIGSTLTLRGKIVLGVAIISIALGVNVLMSGKSISCDWRGQIEACSIEKG